MPSRPSRRSSLRWLRWKRPPCSSITSRGNRSTKRPPAGLKASSRRRTWRSPTCWTRWRPPSGTMYGRCARPWSIRTACGPWPAGSWIAILSCPEPPSPSWKTISRRKAGCSLPMPSGTETGSTPSSWAGSPMRIPGRNGSANRSRPAKDTGPSRTSTRAAAKC